jgi:guanylate kinase
MPVIPALSRLRQEDQEFEASLCYTARFYLKKRNKETNKYVYHFMLGVRTI